MHSEQNQLESSSDSGGYDKTKNSYPLSPIINKGTLGINESESD